MILRARWSQKTLSLLQLWLKKGRQAERPFELVSRILINRKIRDWLFPAANELLPVNIVSDYWHFLRLREVSEEARLRPS